MTRHVLDLDTLAANTWILQAKLFASAAVGVVLGLTIVFVTTAITMVMVPGGFLVTIWAMVAAGVVAVRMVALAVAAIILIPLGALIAARLKLRSVAEYVVQQCGAKILPDTHPVGASVSEMTRLAGLTIPPRYGILENECNAFALGGGRDSSLVLLGRPLAAALEPHETLAVIGHELGHIAMQDSKRKMLALGHQEFLVRFLVFARLQRWARNLFGFVGELALAALSRHREYWADAVGAYVTSPEAMMSALRKLETLTHRPTAMERNYAALMFRPVPSLFATHPTMAQRIAALERRTYLDRLPTRVEHVSASASAPEAAPVYTGI